MCALDLLSLSGFVNYFGKQTKVDDIQISPLLIKKGSTQLALYGLGNIRDLTLHRSFLSNKVKLTRPLEDGENWFNLMVLHQNRCVFLYIILQKKNSFFKKKL